MSSVAYIMQWGDHKTNVHNHLRVLFEEQKFVDLTLFCSTHSVKVHSVVIASNSSYFEKVLLSQKGVNSVIVLKDMKFEVLRSLIEFMYCGETTVLDEDVDALLCASKKFEVKGLSRMTRQGVMFSAAEKVENETTEPSHKFIFPAESAHPGMIQAVIDLTKKSDETQVLDDRKLDSLGFNKTAVFQRRGRPHKKHEALGFSEAAMSDTEYAILKEAEESRKALEKLQKYVLNPNGIEMASRVPAGENQFFKPNKNQCKQNESKPLEHSYSNLRHSLEDKIAAENLSNELNQQVKLQQDQQQLQSQYFQPSHPDQYRPKLELNIQQQQQRHDQQDHSNLAQKLLQSNMFESTLLPADVPIFVDDGNGNYVSLDVEMANMIAGQEIKYNLVQGLVMTSDGKGSQLSNPANILIPENQHLNAQFENMPILDTEEIELPKLDVNFQHSDAAMETSEKFLDFETDSLLGKHVSKRKPFVVNEIIKLKHPKRNSPKMPATESGGLGEDEDRDDGVGDAKEDDGDVGTGNELTPFPAAENREILF